ncbi:hypothetical protein D3C77_565320 [compost metagenome]
MVIDLVKGFTGIDHVVNQQHAPGQGAARDGDELGDIHVALLRAGGLAIAAGRQDAQRHVKNTGHNIADAHAAARQTQNLVELPSRLVHLQGKALDQPVVIVPRHPQMAFIIGRRAHR